MKGFSFTERVFNWTPQYFAEINPLLKVQLDSLHIKNTVSVIYWGLYAEPTGAGDGVSS